MYTTIMHERYRIKFVYALPQGCSQLRGGYFWNGAQDENGVDYAYLLRQAQRKRG